MSQEQGLRPDWHTGPRPRAAPLPGLLPSSRSQGSAWGLSPARGLSWPDAQTQPPGKGCTGTPPREVGRETHSRGFSQYHAGVCVYGMYFHWVLSSKPTYFFKN